MDLGPTIRRLRRERCMTQADLADMAGIRQETLSRIENGKAENPTLDTVRSLLLILGYTLTIQVIQDRD